MSKVIELLARVEIADPFDYDPDLLRNAQIGALAESFEQGRRRIAALDRVAQEQRVRSVESIDDVVPLLFSHTTYKSYPDALVRHRQWSKLATWLDMFSSHSTANMADFTGVQTLDEWIARLHQDGHYVYASSGTTGKCSLMNQSAADLERLRTIRVGNMSWSTGAAPDQSRQMFFPVPPQPSHQVQRVFEIYAEAFGRPGCVHWLTETPLLVSDINRAGKVREAIKMGSVLPSEIAESQREAEIARERSAAGFRAMASAIDRLADEPAMVCGTWAQHWHLAAALEANGSRGLNPDSIVSTGGGLKGLSVPPDYEEIIAKRYGIPAENFYRQYGATEINSHMLGCRAGRYHVPPWVIALVLDKTGETLLPLDESAVGRMAFFDFAITGRWGGVITGDKVTVERQCPCGRRSPAVSKIERYADLEEGEGKLSCAGTMESYVRGEFGA